MTTVPVDVLYCIDSLPPTGGTEGQLAGLIERLDRARFRPHLCTIKPASQTRPLTDCHHLALNVPKLAGIRSLAAARELARYLKRHRIRIVHSFFQDATVFSLWTARWAGVPVRLGSLRDLGFWRERRIEFLMRRTYPLMSALVANSRAVKERFVQDDGLDPRRIHVIPNGVDTAAFAFHPQGPEPPTVLFLGNLNRKVKRPDLFLRAAARVAPRYPSVRWLVVGDGEFRPELETLGRELGLGERVVFSGRQIDISSFLARSAIGVNCSDSEGFSNAVLEYMLAGCVVVATAVGGNLELIRQGEDGVLVAPDDDAALAEAIGRLLADPGLAARLRAAARRRVESEYGWERCCASHQDLYRKLLGEHGDQERGSPK